MIKLTYGKRFRAISDFEVDDIFERIKDIIGNHYQGGFSTANIFNRIRLGVINGEISPSDVVFIFNGQEMHIKNDGDVENWVSGFLTKDAEMARAILVGGTKIRIEKQKP